MADTQATEAIEDEFGFGASLEGAKPEEVAEEFTVPDTFGMLMMDDREASPNFTNGELIDWSPWSVGSKYDFDLAVPFEVLEEANTQTWLAYRMLAVIVRDLCGGNGGFSLSPEQWAQVIGDAPLNVQIMQRMGLTSDDRSQATFMVKAQPDISSKGGMKGD